MYIVRTKDPYGLSCSKHCYNLKYPLLHLVTFLPFAILVTALLTHTPSVYPLDHLFEKQPVEPTLVTCVTLRISTF